MPLSFIHTNGDGTTTNFAIPFQFLSPSHIHAYVANTEVAFSWVNASTIQITPAPPSGTLNVELRRITPRDQPLVDYSNGSVLYDYDLDATNLQGLFIAQEYYEQSVNNFPSGHTLDSHSDATVGESTVRGAMRIYGTDSKTKAIIATDGGILQGDANTTLGAKFLPVGTHGQTLEVDTSQSGKLSWKQGLRNLITAVGDLLVGNGFGSANTLPIGANNQVLVVDNTTTLKTKWSNIFWGGTYNSPTINTPTILGSTVVGTSNWTTTGGIVSLQGDGGSNYFRIGSCLTQFGTIDQCTFQSGVIHSSTINSSTINSPSITGAVIGTNNLKTATGAASGIGNAQLQVNMNDFSFFPQLFSGTGESVDCYNAADNGTVVGRFRIASQVGTATHGARWRYMTASDNPVMWFAFNPETGDLMGTWTSDDPTPGDIPGIEIPGATIIRATSQDLEHLSPLTTKADDAAAVIRDTKRRMQHQAYRAMQLYTGQDAPSVWLLENCKMNLSTNKLEMK